MEREFVEIEEHFKDGQVIRRYVNGVEVEPDTMPTAIQWTEYVVTKKYMTPESFNNKYGDINNMPKEIRIVKGNKEIIIFCENSRFVVTTLGQLNKTIEMLLERD